jgi:superfamily I DNA/RNA helicase
MNAEGAAKSPRLLAGKLIDLTRNTLKEPTEENLREIADHYGLPVEPHQWTLVRDLVSASLEHGVMDAPRTIDYTDMVWLPSALDLPVDQYDWVLVDECQDLNAAQLALALKLCKAGGRMLFVGDPYQAIYGFAGADCDSFWNIQKKTSATVLPLSICYRCPSEHVWLAQEIVPSIEAAPGAIEGGVHDLDFACMIEMLEKDDVVLCRNTAPLIPACYAMLAEGKPAYVAGRAIGEGIAKTVEESCDLYYKAEGKYATMGTLGEGFDLWEAKEKAALKRRKVDEDSQQWSDLSDRLDCVRIFWSRSENTGIDGFLAEIRALFSDNKDNATRMSTVHRAKGLEANRVFLLKPELMPSPYARMSWERQQEENLRYVALTRATEALHFVDGPV